MRDIRYNKETNWVDVFSENGWRPYTNTQHHPLAIRASCEMLLRRKQLGWSQKRLAEEAGLPVTTVCKLEDPDFPTKLDDFDRVMCVMGRDVELVVEYSDR